MLMLYQLGMAKTNHALEEFLNFPPQFKRIFLAANNCRIPIQVALINSLTMIAQEHPQ